MILLAAGYGEDIILILVLLLILLLIIYFLKGKIIFRVLARINRFIFPSLYKNDLLKLKNHEKVILAYRYWITKNSL